MRSNSFVGTCVFVMVGFMFMSCGRSHAQDLGACCSTGCYSNCLDDVTASDCAALGGSWTFSGIGTVCGISDSCGSPGPACCKGDVDGDGQIDGRDIDDWMATALTGNCFATPERFCRADVNHDFAVNAADLADGPSGPGLVSLLLSSGPCPAVGSNDVSCFGAVLVPADGTPIVFDNTDATMDSPPHGISCHFDGPGTPLDKSLWFKFVATHPVAIISTCHPNTTASDTVIAVWSDCPPATEIACNDDGVCSEGFFLSIVGVTGLAPGQTYYVEVGSYDETWAGQIEMTINSFASPANDDCTGVVDITCGSSVTFNNAGAAADDHGVSCTFPSGSPISNSVWYRFQATAATASVSTCNPGTTAGDTLVAVWDNCNIETQLGCNDDAGCGPSANGSIVNLAGLTVGDFYYIEVGSRDASTTGNIELSVECGVINNDLCGDAIDVTCGSSVVFNNTTATVDAGSPGVSCHFSGPGTPIDKSLWFSFEATATTALISTCNPQTTAGDTAMAVWTECPPVNEIACSDEAGCGLGGFGSVIYVTGLIPGSTYFIEVGSFSQFYAGQIELSVQCGVPVSDDFCAGATNVPCGASVIFDNTTATTDNDSPGASCHFDGPGTIIDRSRWFSFQATAETATVSTCNDDTLAADTVMAVWSECPPVNEIGCSEDAGCGPGGVSSTISLSGLTPGNTYYIEVGSYNPFFAGQIELSVTCP